jgi:hypothetical protein
VDPDPEPVIAGRRGYGIRARLRPSDGVSLSPASYDSLSPFALVLDRNAVGRTC